MKEIVMASGNKGKIKEAEEILEDFKLVSMKELGIEVDIEEDKDTFAGNASRRNCKIVKRKIVSCR